MSGTTITVWWFDQSFGSTVFHTPVSEPRISEYVGADWAAKAREIEVVDCDGEVVRYWYRGDGWELGSESRNAPKWEDE